MTEWIALLRGVNVNGINIRNAELAEVFTGLGYTGVRTVLASGNVIFTTAAYEASTPSELASIRPQIAAPLAARFNYQAWIVLITHESLRAVVANFPFERDDETWYPYVMFGSDQSVLDELAVSATDPAKIDPASDLIAPGEAVLYWHNNRTRGIDSAFSKLAAKAKYKSSTTNRNLRTLEKLLA